MKPFWNGRLAGLWATPVLMGLLLILVGVVIFRNPDLLAYLVAATFILAGVVLIGVGLSFRRSVKFRRIDQVWRVEDQREE